MIGSIANEAVVVLHPRATSDSLHFQIFEGAFGPDHRLGPIRDHMKVLLEYSGWLTAHVDHPQNSSATFHGFDACLCPPKIRADNGPTAKSPSRAYCTVPSGVTPSSIWGQARLWYV